jgi:hypothetical protein
VLKIVVESAKGGFQKKTGDCRAGTSVMNALSEAQKLQSKTLSDLVNSVNDLKAKTNKMEEHLANRKEVTPTIATIPFNDM